jgi:hypothetical protein
VSTGHNDAEKLLDLIPAGMQVYSEILEKPRPSQNTKGPIQSEDRFANSLGFLMIGAKTSTTMVLLLLFIQRMSRELD